MKNVLTILLVYVVSGGCIEEYPIDLPFEGPRIVIDGLVSSEQGESYVNIGWSTATSAVCRSNFGDIVPCEPGTFDGPYKVNGRIRITENDVERSVELPFQMDDKAGMILIKPDLVGTPGSTYKLEVEIDYEGTREYYSASTKMLPTPQITNIDYEIRKGDIGKHDNFVPLISFTEPVEENFYLFQLCSVYFNDIYCGNSRVWSYSLIADTFLPSEVQGLSVDDGASIAKYAEFYPAPEQNAGAQVRMWSADRETFYFYKALLDQFNNDGGAYSPTPAMPEGNISGNGIGLFRALQESSATVYYK